MDLANYLLFFILFFVEIGLGFGGMGFWKELQVSTWFCVMWIY